MKKKQLLRETGRMVKLWDKLIFDFSSECTTRQRNQVIWTTKTFNRLWCDKSELIQTCCFYVVHGGERTQWSHQRMPSPNSFCFREWGAILMLGRNEGSFRYLACSVNSRLLIVSIKMCVGMRWPCTKWHCSAWLPIRLSHRNRQNFAARNVCKELWQK